MASTLLKLDGICLEVMGQSILLDVNLKVQPKEIHALVGKWLGKIQPGEAHHISTFRKSTGLR